MGSREKDQTTPHQQPLLSSLVVRPSNSEGGGGRGSYEPGEVRREPPSYSRSNRYSDDAALNVACNNLNLEEGSGSPIRRRADHRFSSDFDHSGGLPRSREFGSGRDPGRYRDSSPHFARGRGGGRPFGRGIDGPEFVPGPLRGEGLSRNNPNVRPREGDWICSDPLCANLNFARREYCNNCNRHRYGSGGSPRRAYPGPPLPNAPPRRLPGPPMDRSPGRGRTINGFRSPPRGWVRDGPREFGSGVVSPAARHENRLPDHPFRRERLDFADDHHRGRTKIERPMPVDWGHRERKAFERRPPSPPAPPPLPPPNRGGRWGRDARGRSRSPIRGGPPPKDYHRDVYMHQRGRDDRRGMGRDRIGGAY